MSDGVIAPRYVSYTLLINKLTSLRQCAPSFDLRPYLISTPEETYSPPPDPDAGLSLEALGMRALMRLPRAQAIDSLRAFNEMRDGLMEYLRPFATEGRVVGEEDVRAFFEQKERQRDGR